ncbi:MAG: hypothetical protein JXJ17_19715 [Anaerolineae bacterium]|nr:hypothetical protein [Anaerolineae bacterium]
MSDDKTQQASPTAGPKLDMPIRDGRKKDKEPRQWPFGYLILWLLVTLSMLFNVVMFRQLLNARNAAGQAVADSIAVIENLQTQSFSTTIVVDETMIIDADTPLNETIPITVDQVLPIDTVVTVPVDAGIFGEIVLDVPIQTEIPVKFEQDVVIDQAFHIYTAIPVYFEVPITLEVADTPFYDTLDDIKGRLQKLEDSLIQPLFPLPQRD